MVNPETRWRSAWDFFVLAVTIFAALQIPLSIIFQLASPALLALISVLVTLAFTADIAVNFNTAFRSQGKLVSGRRAVASRYLRGWFWIDLLAALPAGLLLFVLPGSAGGLMPLLRLNRLLKLPRIIRTLRRVGSTRFNPAILRLVWLVFWILLAAHFIACGWIFITGNPEELDPPALYIRAFYWTITTLTTIGYGDITPSGSLQTLYVIIIELLGAAMYGLIIGNIANLIANIDVAKAQYKEKLDKINTFLRYRNIPGLLQKKINDYYTYLWESRRGYDESAVLEDLPDPLKISVSLHINKEIIERVPIFESANEDFIKEIILHLTPVVFTPGDTIFKAGEVGFDMYFISRGSVDVMSADEQTIYATLREGQFFGEIALLLSTPRNATIKAREYCDLYRLDKETFDRVLKRYPEFAETIYEMADKRRAEIDVVAVDEESVEEDD